VTAPRLGVRGVLVERAGRPILAVEELDVQAGEVLAVVGPNGAGKSTLIHVLALLERPSGGEVLFDGRPTRGSLLSYRRRMAVVFQEPLLLDATVESNVGSGLALRGVPRGERERRVRHWLKRFGIEDLARRSARTLSGGEAQRTSLARALVLGPDILLLDEPSLGLAPTVVQEIFRIITTINREEGITVLLVEQKARLALGIAQFAYVLESGSVALADTSESLGQNEDVRRSYLGY